MIQYIKNWTPERTHVTIIIIGKNGLHTLLLHAMFHLKASAYFETQDLIDVGSSPVNVL